jgi:hypothetical protein
VVQEEIGQEVTVPSIERSLPIDFVVQAESGRRPFTVSGQNLVGEHCVQGTRTGARAEGREPISWYVAVNYRLICDLPAQRALRTPIIEIGGTINL